MPTGYTADVGDGKVAEFSDFALSCSRAFGALVMLRDHDQSLEATRRYLASGKYANESSYYQDSLRKAAERLTQLEEMTDEEARLLALKEAEELRQTNRRYAEKTQAQRMRYEAMVEKVEAWEPPTDDHLGLKNFMLEQLHGSIDFDCTPVELHGPDLSDGWREREIAKQRDRIIKDAKDIVKEHARNEQRRQWVEALLESLEAAWTSLRVLSPGRCSICANLGWILEANGAGLTPPLSLELIPCIHPECPVETPDIASIVFKGPRFSNIARHPADNYVMSVSA
jgi:hypothetical protein